MFEEDYVYVFRSSLFTQLKSFIDLDFSYEELLNFDISIDWNGIFRGLIDGKFI